MRTIKKIMPTRKMLAYFPLFCSTVILAKEQKPNIILLLVDDVPPSYFGCYSGKTPTPHINQLAKEGVQFTQAYSASSMSNPSRYTLLTGQYPGRNAGVLKTAGENDTYFIGQNTLWTEQNPSIARVLKSAGYYTGFVGKWHSNFDMFEGGEKKPELSDKDSPETNRVLAALQKEYVTKIKKVSGFDVVSNIQVGNLDRLFNQQHWLGYHNTEWFTQGALDFIDDAAKKKKPFFIHLANSVPHSPDVLVSLEHDNQYTPAGKLDKPLTCHPPHSTVKERLKTACLNTSGPIGSINAGAVVLDDQLEAIINKLKETGQLENTMIIFTSDHSVYGKGTCYAPGNHVPLIISWPASLPKGTINEVPVSLVDLFKTCTEAAGAKLPAQKTDGHSLIALMKGETTEHPLPYQEANFFRAVVKGKYHYVAFRPSATVIEIMQNGSIDYAADHFEGKYRNIFGELNIPFKPSYLEADQLYDLEHDPLERHNLANLPAYAHILADMKKELATYTESFDKPFPLTVPEFMNSTAYAEQVSKRKTIAAQRGHYPQGYDCERIFNDNLLDPLAE